MDAFIGVIVGAGVVIDVVEHHENSGERHGSRQPGRYELELVE